MVMKVTASKLKELVNGRRLKMGDGTVINTLKSIAVEGAPGMGKTAIIGSIAKDWNLPFTTVAINQWATEADIVGFKYEGGMVEGNFELETADAMPPWLPVYRKAPNGAKVETSDKTKGLPVWINDDGQAEAHPAVILLDEFSAARPAVQMAFLTVALTKIVKNFRLNPDTTFFVAFNGCKRQGFRGMTNEISQALVGPNGRFDCVELVYESNAVLNAVLENPNISDFWKRFSEKFLDELHICDDEVKTDYNSCGRTYESLMIELSICGYDSSNFNDDAKFRVELNFDGSPCLAKDFIQKVKTFNQPTGADYLSGKEKIDSFSKAIVAVHAIGNYLGFRKRAKQEIISTAENKFLKELMDTKYPTGMKNASGKMIMGSKKELYMTLKASLLRQNLQTNANFRWVANTIEDFDKKPESEEEIEF